MIQGLKNNFNHNTVIAKRQKCDINISMLWNLEKKVGVNLRCKLE